MEFIELKVRSKPHVFIAKEFEKTFSIEISDIEKQQRITTNDDIKRAILKFAAFGRPKLGKVLSMKTMPDRSVIITCRSKINMYGSTQCKYLFVINKNKQIDE